MLKNRQKNQYQSQPKKGFTPPRQLGISHKYAKLGGSDDRFSSLYKEIDIEIRSFVSYDQEGKSNGQYFRLLENGSSHSTFDKLGEVDKEFLNIVNSRIQQGWIMIKGDNNFFA